MTIYIYRNGEEEKEGDDIDTYQVKGAPVWEWLPISTRSQSVLNTNHPSQVTTDINHQEKETPNPSQDTTDKEISTAVYGIMRYIL